MASSNSRTACALSEVQKPILAKRKAGAQKHYPSPKIGSGFGRLTVEDVLPPTKQYRRWRVLCRCTCGRVKLIREDHLRTGRSRSCGCLNALTKGGTTHGQSKSPTYQSWSHMMARCYNSNRANFRHYGARGISVCRRWHKFENFFADMGARPEGTTLDRVDVNGNYKLSNCRWADPTIQARNRRSNHYVAFQGENLTVTEWAQRIGITRIALIDRLELGWPLTLALTLGSQARGRAYT